MLQSQLLVITQCLWLENIYLSGSSLWKLQSVGNLKVTRMAVCNVPAVLPLPTEAQTAHTSAENPSRQLWRTPRWPRDTGSDHGVLFPLHYSEQQSSQKSKSTKVTACSARPVPLPTVTSDPDPALSTGTGRCGQRPLAQLRADTFFKVY